MEDTQENTALHCPISEAVIRELAKGEIRSQRSLRVLQHQEGRIAKIENELRGKSSMLQQLQESHTDLIEAHRYQAEVHDLQKELIKLQEIQYLSTFIQSKTEENFIQESPKEETFLHDELNDSNKKCSQVALCKSSASKERCFADTRNATDNAERSESENQTRKEFCSLKSRLGSFGTLLQQQEHTRKNIYGEYPCSENNSSQCNGYFALNHVNGDCVAEENFRLHPQQTSNDNDDDDDQILILKETLSSHKRSIEDLSSEVLILRREKSDLLSYVESLLEWKTKMENSLEASGIMKKDAKWKDNEQSEKEVDVIMPVSKNCNRLSHIHIPELRQCSTSSKRVQLDVKASTNDDIFKKTEQENRGWDGFCEDIGTKLVDRSRRLWETACKYFTPKQANFILTAPITSSEEHSSADD